MSKKAKEELKKIMKERNEIYLKLSQAVCDGIRKDMRKFSKGYFNRKEGKCLKKEKKEKS